METKAKKLKTLVNYAIRAQARGSSSTKQVWWCANSSGESSINDAWSSDDSGAFLTDKVSVAKKLMKKIVDRHQKDDAIKNIRLIKITMERTVKTEVVSLEPTPVATPVEAGVSS